MKMTADQVKKAIKNSECFEIDYSGMTKEEKEELDDGLDMVFRAAEAWANLPTGTWQGEECTTEQLDGTYETYTRHTCSNCGQANTWGEVPYCPWCGAKMEVKS